MGNCQDCSIITTIKMLKWFPGKGRKSEIDGYATIYALAGNGLFPYAGFSGCYSPNGELLLPCWAKAIML